MEKTVTEEWSHLPSQFREGPEGLVMIDLSYLMEEEREMILMVLKRDADLKKAEEHRIGELERLQDKSQLKFLTGQWFYEVRSHRHRIQGSEIIKASLRRRKPAAAPFIAESTQLEKPCSTSSGKQDTTFSAGPSQITERAFVDSQRELFITLPVFQQERANHGVKQRSNPFNTALMGPEVFQESESKKTIAMDPLKSSEGGQHDYQPEPHAYLAPSHSSLAHEGSEAALESQEITEEGESVLKVLEWFSRSSDNDDKEIKLTEESKYPKDVSTTSNGCVSIEVLSQKRQEQELSESGNTEDKDIVPGVRLDEMQIPESNNGYDSESFGMYLPLQRRFISTVEIQTGIQRESERIMPNIQQNAELNEQKVLESWHDVKPIEAQDEKLPRIVSKMKSFWEKGNGVEVLNSGSGEELKKEETEISQTDVCRNNSETAVYLGEDATLSIGDNLHETYDLYGVYKTHTFHSATPDFQSGEQLVAIEDNIKHEGVTDNSGGASAARKSEDAKYESSYLLDSHNDQEISSATQYVMKDWMKYAELPVSTHEQQTTQLQQIEGGPNQTNLSASQVGQLKSMWQNEVRVPKIADNSKEVFEIKLTKPAVESSTDKSFANSTLDLKRMETELSSEHVRATSSPLRQNPKFTVLSMRERMERLQENSPVDSQFKNTRDFWLASSLPDPQYPAAEAQLTSPKRFHSEGAEPQGLVQWRGTFPAVESKTFVSQNDHLQALPLDSGKTHARQLSGENKELNIFMNIPSSKREIQDKDQPLLISLVGEGQEVGSSPLGETKIATSESPHWLSTDDGQGKTSLAQVSVDEVVESQSIIILEEKGTPIKPARWNLRSLDERPNAPQKSTVMYLEKLQKEKQPDSPVDVLKYEENQIAKPTFYKEGDYRKPLSLEEIEVLGISEKENLSELGKAECQSDTKLLAESKDQAIGFMGSQMTKSSSDEGQWNPAQHVAEGDELGMTFRTSSPEVVSLIWTSPVRETETSSVPSLKSEPAESPVRLIASYKSVEDLTLGTTGEEEKRNVDGSKSFAVYDVSTGPFVPKSSFAELDKLKNLSVSVPDFLLDESPESGSDSTYASSFHGRMGRSLTSLSSSSDFASVSSVSESVVSLYSGDFVAVEVKGTIQFSISYEQKLKELHIFIVQCGDLAIADQKKHRTDPYVKSYLLPDKAKMGKRKTSVKKKTLNPTFNELLRYRAGLALIQTQTLNLSVWHNDTFGRNSFLGEVDIDLSTWDFRSTPMNNMTLKPRITSKLQPSDYRGEMTLAVRFLPEIAHSQETHSTMSAHTSNIQVSNSGEVHIWVKECKNLPIVRGSTVDPFVKCFIFPDTSRRSRQKTRVLKRTANPAFNHTMVIDGFQEGDLREACAELTVWDHDRLSNHFLGGLRLSLGSGKSYGSVVNWMDSSADESKLWKRMMESPSEWVEETLPLRGVTPVKHTWKK
ncbi:synaptotagmin-like protein 2 [Brienomyrus brachyistius]|uniref:synaptotagmin-like protein 2 n=1 Tax=Brienomyrus brachyistius TaxID=42636 RepID=UPI0020B3CD2A|nr:synaptotagmin-like protein 2 [Brienomyrus brachyistius]